jgi:hypothetical protein
MQRQFIFSVLICLIGNYVIADWNCLNGGFNGTCIQLFEDPRTWNEAHSLCSRHGGELPGAHHKVISVIVTLT